MKNPNANGWLLITMLSIFYLQTHAQTCPVTITTTINSGNFSATGNTYFAAAQATANAGSTSIVLGAAGYGSTPISASDILLIIQMQGAQINSGNGTAYGSNTATGRGYLTTQLLAGNMEYVVANNAVPVTGGTLNLKSALTKSYKNSAFGTDGQYSYQVIRVPLYYDISLSTDITVPDWNGSTGGVLVLACTDILNMNGHQINATGAGFRGGGGKRFGGTGGGGTYTDYAASSTVNACASKGEGIAGTPRYINNNGTLLDNGTAQEGYPNGSFDRGSPGNAGGGGTDGSPNNNSNNSGGGGGSNGGTGGGGGNSWSTNRPCGGIGAAAFAQASASRLVMGGGGGAGSTDGGTGTPANGFASSGTAGGGIVILSIGSFSGTGTINANGDAPNTTLQNDGAGGSGAGGSVLVTGGGSLTGLTVHADGAKGASNTGGAAGPSPHGPGGGGGGGVIYSTGALNAGSTSNGGAAGTTTGGVNYGATAGAAGLNQVVTISSTPFFPISCSVLATNFLSASISSKYNNNILNWSVADNDKVQQYNIERSADGINFVSIATVLLQSTGSNNKLYQYTDADAATRVSEPQLYYRIKLVEISGNVIYSKVMQAKSSLQTTGLTISPNPVADVATLYFLADNLATISVQVVDLKGKSVWKKQYPAGVGMNMLPLNNLQALPDGVYIIKVSNGRQIQSVKMLVRH
ncbi:MAG: T9SS type A sorting domain-containing protein [Niastella sp.]|uniref:T9SS type A sorting domain-containing protein n=1 Tax=Niastella sp. TaxID=1869183 RepID=UPI00389ACB29